MKIQSKITLLSEFINPITYFPYSKVEKLFDYLTYRKLPKGTVLREINEAENSAHLVISGIAAFIKDNKLIRPFFKNQIAFDKNAFTTATPSQYELKALTDIVVITVSKKDVQDILFEFPEFQKVLDFVHTKTNEADREWLYVATLHYTLALLYLKNKLQIDERLFTKTQLGQMLGVNSWSIKRYQKALVLNRNNLKIQLLTSSHFHYPFTSLLHPDVTEINELVKNWVDKMQFLPYNKSAINHQKLKITWLSARLYPELDFKKSVWIAKLFAVLFILDEYLGKIPIGNKSLFWDKLYKQLVCLFTADPFIPYDNKNPFVRAIKQLWQEFIQEARPEMHQCFKYSILNYITENTWKATNLDARKIPELKVYEQKRAVLSGGQLALALLPFTLEQNFPDIHRTWPELLEFMELGSKMIFVANEFLSYEKEVKLKDPHNWIGLIMYHNNTDWHEAFNSINKAHKENLQKFLDLELDIKQTHLGNKRTHYAAIDAIKIQLSGALDWSLYDSRKYISF